jgi:hypothetical protein
MVPSRPQIDLLALRLPGIAGSAAHQAGEVPDAMDAVTRQELA